MSKLTDINGDSPIMFKQITMGIFTTTQAQAFNIKTELYSMDLKRHKYNILDFHLSVDNKIDMCNAVLGEHPADKGIIVGLFKAYKTSNNLHFKEHVHFLKYEYHEGHFTDHRALMRKIKIKYDELLTNKQWKEPKKEDDPRTAPNDDKLHNKQKMNTSEKQLSQNHQNFKIVLGGLSVVRALIIASGNLRIVK
jgi:hypothetical protein